MLRNGFCTQNNCPYNHNQLICRTCGVVSPNPHSHKTHSQGRFHQRMMRGTTYPPGVETQFCATCNRTIATGNSWKSHIQGRHHQRHLRFIKIESAIDDAEKDKHGISVTEGPVDFGIIEVNKAKDGHKMDILIQNSVPESRIYLMQARLSSQINGRRISGCAYISEIFEIKLITLLSFASKAFTSMIGPIPSKLPHGTASLFPFTRIWHTEVAMKTDWNFISRIGTFRDHSSLPARFSLTLTTRGTTKL